MSRKKRSNENHEDDVIGVDSALSDQQLKAIDLLIAGKTITDAANEIGIRRETISRWQSKDPFFLTVLSERRESVWAASYDQLRGNLLAASEKLGDLISHDDPDIALKAINIVFKSATVFPHNGRVNRMTHAQLERKILFDAM